MAHYCIWPKEDDVGEAYWVEASSGDEARRLVALNVNQARDAQHFAAFECVVDDTKAPPFGLIYRRLNGPVTIAKR